MSIKLLLVFAATEILLCLTPGPAVLLVVSQSVRSGFNSSQRGMLGILAGNSVYFVLSALGLGALLLSSATLFQAIKWVGAAYLVFIGLKMLLAKKSMLESNENSIEAIPSMRFFSQGLITQLSNPKAIVFFSALLPQFVTSDTQVAEQFAILGVVSLAIELCVLMSYGWAAERSSRLISKGKFSLVTDRIAGGFLIGAGFGLAVSRT